MSAMDVLDRALPDLRCLRGDHGALRRQATALCCATCGARFLLRGTIVDFVPEIGASTSRAQRAMESPWVAKIYEDHWRPWFTWLGSRLDYAGEERWLRAHDDDWSEGVALDLACGTGRYTRLLSRDRPERMVIGADLSMPMLEQATLRVQAEGLRNVLLVRADAEHLPLRDGSVTRINCFGALHLFPSTERALAELGRVAHSGAGFTCLTAGEHARPLGRRLQRVFSRAASFAFFESRSLERMLGTAGFEGYQEERHGAVLLFAARRRARGGLNPPHAGSGRAS